jgi:hypothetical protein
MKNSSLAYIMAVIILLGGMAWGLTMAISGNHAPAAAHAHLNLLGWVSLFLLGLFLERRANLDSSRIATIAIVVWTIAVIGQAIGVGLIAYGVPAAEPVAAISSIILFASAALFAFLVITNRTA